MAAYRIGIIVKLPKQNLLGVVTAGASEISVSYSLFDVLAREATLFNDNILSKLSIRLASL